MLKQIFKYPEMYIISAKSKIQFLLNEEKYKQWFLSYHPLFVGKLGLEIGGPSNFFQSAIMPIYELANSIDGCNYSQNTVWENEIKSSNYNYHKDKSGNQFILEGTDLSILNDEQYDFILSCHNIEHIANPLKAIAEWSRVLKKGGTMLIIVPDKRYTFDRKRPYTTFSHLLDDYKNAVDEHDLTHLNEVLSLHDLKLDPPNKNDFQSFENRCKNNFVNRCIHHHVFSEQVLDEMLAYMNIQTLSQKFIPPNSKIIIGTK